MRVSTAIAITLLIASAACAVDKACFEKTGKACLKGKTVNEASLKSCAIVAYKACNNDKVPVDAKCVESAGRQCLAKEGKKDEATYKMAHEDAVNALDMAASVDSEWRDSRWKKSKAVKVKIDGQTKKMSYLHAAEAYAKMGDWENAVKYAEIARFQGMAGYQQGVGQKNAGPTF